MIELRVLGSADLRNHDGSELRSVLAQPKRLALLAYLALAKEGGFVRRDTILGLFWPDSDRERARAALRKTLQRLRESLGEGAVTSRGDEEVGVDATKLWCDAAAFRIAANGSDHTRALELYRGELLPGFFLADAPEFERWLEEERARLRALAIQSARRLCEQHAATGEITSALAAAQRGLELDPTDETQLRRSLELRCSEGDRAGAMQMYEAFVRRLDREYGIEPSGETQALAARLRAVPASRTQAEPRPATTQLNASIGAPDSVALPLERVRAPAGTRRVMSLLLIVLGLVTAGLWLRPKLWRPAGSVTTVAVFPFAVRGNPELQYLREGLAELLSRNLDGVAELRSADPVRVFNVWSRAGSAQPSLEQSHQMARSAGAGLFVIGSLTEVSGRLRLRASLFEAVDSLRLLGSTEEIEGDANEVFRIVDRATAELLTLRFGQASARLVKTAALTTPSLAALKNFLRAEQHLRRNQTDSAIGGFQEAISADSTFALAHYRLAVSTGISSKYGAAPAAIDQALLRADKLSPHDRALLHAYAAYSRGDAEDAEQRYRAVLRDYPADTEARFQLGQLLFRYNPMRGRSIMEAKAEYDVAMENDPRFFCPI